MNNHQAVLAALEAHAPLVAAVGGRIRPDMARPNDNYPFVVFRRSDYEEELHLDDSVSAIREEFEVECWGERRSQTVQIAQLAIAALRAAGLAPEKGEPDSMEPEFLQQVNIIKVEIITT